MIVLWIGHQAMCQPALSHANCFWKPPDQHMHGRNGKIQTQNRIILIFHYCWSKHKAERAPKPLIFHSNYHIVSVIYIHARDGEAVAVDKWRMIRLSGNCHNGWWWRWMEMGVSGLGIAPHMCVYSSRSYYIDDVKRKFSTFSIGLEDFAIWHLIHRNFRFSLLICGETDVAMPLFWMLSVCR